MSELYNRDAEQAVVGGLLMNPNAYHAVAGQMTADDLHAVLYRNIYKAIGKLVDAHADVDMLTVQAELERGGVSVRPHEITEVMLNVPSSMHVESYAKEVADLAARRRLLASASDIAQMASDITAPINIGDISERMYATVRTRGKTADNWNDALDKFQLDLIERMETEYEDVWGMSYGGGFQRLNRATGGAHTSEFVILAGEPGIGKSVIVGDWVADFSLQHAGVMYSMEMPSNTWIRRLVSRLSRESARNLMRGELSNTESVFSAIEQLRMHQVFLSDHEDWTSDELRADLTRLKHWHNIQWVVIDHMGLLSDIRDDDISGSRDVAQRLRKTCRALEIHMLGISAVTKDGMHGEVPNMSNVRGSGEVLHEADVVYWMNPFTPMTDREKRAFENLSAEEKYATKSKMRTFFILKGRHMADPNMHRHMAFADDRPTLAESEFPQGRFF